MEQTVSQWVTTDTWLTPQGILAFGRPFRDAFLRQRAAGLTLLPPTHTQIGHWMRAALGGDLGQNPSLLSRVVSLGGTQLRALGARTSRRWEMSSSGLKEGVWGGGHTLHLHLSF